MPPTLIRPRPQQTATSPGRVAVGWVAAGAAALIGAVVAGEVLDPPPTVDLVVVNRSAQEVTVVVAGADGGPVLPVATVEAGEERPVEEVLDQGRSWVVSFLVAGAAAGELEATRAQLEADGFRIVVPDALVVEGAAPTDAEGSEG